MSCRTRASPSQITARRADFAEQCGTPRRLLWATDAAVVLAVQLSLTPSSPNFAACGANALAVLFVATGGLLLHDVQRLDSGCAVVGLQVPRALALAGASHGGAVTRVPVQCFAVCPLSQQSACHLLCAAPSVLPERQSRALRCALCLSAHALSTVPLHRLAAHESSTRCPRRFRRGGVATGA